MSRLDDLNNLKRSLLKGVTVSRLTLPDDANVYGNVHGGTTLKLIEEAGIILSTRYCNYAKDKAQGKISTTMLRIESVDFLKPMKIGEVVELTAEIIYTSDEAILVEVTVDSENIVMAEKQTTNKARLWYVALNEAEEVTSIPQMPFDSPQLKEEAKKKFGNLTFSITNGSLSFGNTISIQKSALFQESFFEKGLNVWLKQSRKPVEVINLKYLTKHTQIRQSKHIFSTSIVSIAETLAHTVAKSETYLSLMVGPNDVAFGQICRAGVFLKLMDECGGIVAAKHCRTNVVTACLDATNFYAHIRMGNVLTVHGKATFTSKKSIEVEIIVYVDSPFNKDEKSIKAVDSFFTYVSIGSDGRALDVPPLKVESDEEKERFDAGMQRYLARKNSRSKNSKP